MPKYKRKKETKYSLAELIEAVEKVRQKKMNSYEASVQLKYRDQLLFTVYMEHAVPNNQRLVDLLNYQ